MAWQDRIKAAAYTSPSGVRLTGDFEDVSRQVDKKTTGFNFPDADGTFVQDLGRTGRRYPFRWFFWGPDCDLEADAFEAALLEPGTGKLEHPLYGTVNVVPFGTITRRDDLKTAANQSVVEVTFWETIGLIYPAAQGDPGAAVLSAVSSYNAAAAESLAASLDLDTASERVSFKNTYTAALDAARNGLQPIADATDAVRRQFNTINASINAGIDVLIADPAALAAQTTQLVQAPARAAAAISDRLTAYADLAGALLAGDGASVQSSYDGRSQNTFRTQDLYASSYLTGSVVSTVNNQFETKTEAIAAAEAVLAQFDELTAWRDSMFEDLGDLDTGETYQQLQEAVALTAGFLVEISFSLKQERRIVLDRARTIVDLSAELYGEIDEQLDFLIASNNLSGSDILELPRGREIVYYI